MTQVQIIVIINVTSNVVIFIDMPKEIGEENSQTEDLDMITIEFDDALDKPMGYFYWLCE
jgi:hypothetical protein